MSEWEDEGARLGYDGQLLGEELKKAANPGGRMDTLRKYWVELGNLHSSPHGRCQEMVAAADVDALLAEQQAEVGRLTHTAEQQACRANGLQSLVDPLQRELAAAKADFEKQKTMTRLEAKANYNAIDEIHLLEAQRDRAEARVKELERGNDALST